MKNFFYLVLFFIFVPTNNLSASINFGTNNMNMKLDMIVRTDYEINNSDDNTLRIAGSNGYAMNTNKELEAMEFKVKTARIKAMGKIDEYIEYYLDWNVNKIFSFSETANSGTVQNINLLDSIDEVWGQYRLVSNFYLNVGKVFSGVGGTELIQQPQEVYLYSLGGTEFSDIAYRPGIIAGVNFYGQELYLAIVNINDNTYNKKMPAAGIVYMGDFLDGAILPILSFHRSQTEKQELGGLSGSSVAPLKVNYYYSAGVGLKMWEEQLFLEVNWLKNIYKDKSSESKSDTTQSIIGEAKINHRAIGFVRPLAKYELSKKTIADSDYLDRMAYVVGLEFFPRIQRGKLDYGLNIHAIYTLYADTYKREVPSTTQFGAKVNGKKITTSQILLGLTLEI
ncbi:MAG: hypothetical protein HQK51_07600 [Oligoflexia bacterium]|nr:hypothetical protein [Oligoflexia bacterium]